ncbi:MAG: hypothetical protein ACO1OO_12920 [Flavisolibacter sp.]
MSYWIKVVLAFTILAPAVAGAIRLKQIDRTYLPFLLMIGAGLLSETVSFILIRKGLPNIKVINFYALTGSLLIVWQFKRWNSDVAYRHLFSAIQVLFLLAWLVEALAIQRMNKVCSYYIIGSSFFIVVLSIKTIASILFFEGSQLLKNPKFLVCVGFIIYFSFTILVEAFWVFGLTKSKEFRMSIYNLLYYINAITNIIYFVSILWMPMRLRYIVQ